MENIEEKDQQTSLQKQALQPLIDSFVESARRSLEYDIIKYSIKRYQSFFCKGYYKKKQYKAILALREFNRDVAKKI